MELINNYCCIQMKIFLNDRNVPIGYVSKYREFYLRLKFTKSVDTFEYCPWCGTRLPESLRDKYFETLELDGIDDPIRAAETGTLPEEFKSDKWWKKRGL